MDVPARLSAIEGSIRAGAAQQAQDELPEILNAPGALAFFDRLLGICLTLGEPSLIDTLMDRVAAQLDPDERIMLEFKVADAFIAKDKRREAFKQLEKIVPLVQGKNKELFNVAEKLSGIGEDSFAAEIFRQLLKVNPDDKLIERHLIRSAVYGRQPGSLERLESFLLQQGMTAIDWEYAVEIFQHQFNHRQVIRCAQQALALGGDPVKNRIALAHAWFHLQKKNKMAAEIKKIPLDKVNDIGGLRNLCHLANAAKDSALAEKIAEVQWSRDKDVTYSTLVFIDFLIMNRNLTKAKLMLDHIFNLIDNDGKNLPRKEFIRLAEICFKTFNSPTLEMRAIELGLKRYPDDAPLTRLKAQHEARQKFMVSHGADIDARAKSSAGLLDRLRRRFSGHRSQRREPDINVS